MVSSIRHEVSPDLVTRRVDDRPRIVDDGGMMTKYRSTTFGLVMGLCAAAAGQSPAPDEEVRWRGNRVNNPSFEDGFAGWFTRKGAEQEGERVESSAAIDDTTAHSGGRSLHLKGDADTTWWWAVETALILARPNARYKLSGWIKTKDVKKKEGQFHNCNFYVQFGNDKGEVVLIDGSPVRATRKLIGTGEWTRVERIVKAPEGATRVTIGCVLSCSGEAWFDDLGFYESEPIAWVQKPIGRFIYNIEAGSDPPPDRAVERNSAFLENLESVIGVEHEGKIRFYKYKNRERKIEVTGSGSESHFEGNEIHSIAWTDPHGMVHLLMKGVGQSSPFLVEGIAVYWADILLNRDVHAKAQALADRGALLPTNRFLNPKFFKMASERLGNPIAGSFVGYLVEEYGMDQFKEWYVKADAGASSKKLREQFRSVYGIEFEEADRAWHDLLGWPVTGP